MAMKIKAKDTVIVLAGKDKGKTGTVKVVYPQGRIVVSGVNMCKKHQKPNPQLGIEGGVVEREASLHISNVAYLNPLTNKAERIGFKKLEDGRKVRLMKSSREIINDE